MTPRERFWAFVDKTGPEIRDGLGPCWIWMGSRNGRGYGQFGANWRKPVYAHRYSWELAHGQEPGDMCVCHHCDTPSCVRPDHLFLGTAKDNARDMVAKGRAKKDGLPGEKNPRAILSEQSARDICREYATGRVSQLELARRYGVARVTIGCLIRGASWPGISAPRKVDGRRGVRGEHHPLAKLTSKGVSAIKLALARGETQRSIARRHGVSQGLINKISLGKVWTHV